MDPWATGIFSITLLEDDLEKASAFYQQVFDLPVVEQDRRFALFRLGDIWLQLLQAPAGSGAAESGSMVIPAEQAPVKIAILVDDVDARCAELQRRGVVLRDGPTNRPWGMREGIFADPGGHVWSVSQDLPDAEPQADR